MNLVAKYKETNLPDYFCDEEPNITYVLYNHNTGLSKIGITSNLNRRVSEICTASGCDVSIIIVIYLHDMPAKFLEKFLHNELKEFRVIGEWFRLTRRELYQIEALFYEIYGEDIQLNIFAPTRGNHMKSVLDYLQIPKR